MDTSKIDEHIAAAARLIREQLAAQVDEWQQVPHWALEADGRSGWSDLGRFPYQHGLWLVDTWPPSMYVECSTGKLIQQVNGTFESPSDEDIVCNYIQQPSLFNVTAALTSLRAHAASNDSFNKAINDENRESLRKQFAITDRHLRPATPVSWAYVD